MYTIVASPILVPVQCQTAQESKVKNANPKNKLVATKKTSLVNRKVLAERLNGRLAMLGFVSGTGYELVTGKNYVEQFVDNWPYVIALSTVVAYGTFTSRLLDDENGKPFTKNQEVLNGRLAMMGIFMKFVYDGLSTHTF